MSVIDKMLKSLAPRHMRSKVERTLNQTHSTYAVDLAVDRYVHVSQELRKELRKQQVTGGRYH
jgi:hypothetical protein